jgi:N6-adenosine-specific RNA methylase IME4
MDSPIYDIAVRVKESVLDLAGRAQELILFLDGLQDAAALKDARDQAKAVQDYLAQKQDLSVADYNAAVALYAKAFHRLGQVLRKTVKHQGGRPRKNGSTNEPFSGNGQVPEGLGAARQQRKYTSSRAQRIARVPWRQIKAGIDKATAKNERAKLGRILKELLQEKQRMENRKLVEGTIRLEEGPGVFQTVVVDPPWDWSDEGDVSQMGRGRNEYATLTFDELLRLPVPEKADKICHLYVWATNRSLPKAFALLEAWGFRYVTNLTWCKPNPGMGNYFRGSTEHVLFGVRGSLGLLRKDAGTWFAAPRQGKHSTKPEEFYRLVESCSPGPWLEVFGRRQRPG